MVKLGRFGGKLRKGGPGWDSGPDKLILVILTKIYAIILMFKNCVLLYILPHRPGATEW